MQLYVLNDGKATGPFDDSQIIERWQRGILKDGDLVWGETLHGWIPLRSIIVDEHSKPTASPANAQNAASFPESKTSLVKKPLWSMEGVSKTRAKRIVRAVADWASAQELTATEVISKVSKEFQIELSWTDALALLGEKAMEFERCQGDSNDRSRSLPSVDTGDAHSPADRTKFYVLVENRPTGPLEEAELISRLKNGDLRGSDLIYAEGLSQWTSVDRLFNVESRFRANKAIESCSSKTADVLPTSTNVRKGNAGKIWHASGPTLITVGVAGIVLLFLISWSHELSLTLLFLVGIGAFLWVLIEGGFIVSILFIALFTWGGMAYVGWRFPAEEEARQAEATAAHLRRVEAERVRDRLQQQEDEKSGATLRAFEETLEKQQAEAIAREKKRLARELYTTPSP